MRIKMLESRLGSENGYDVHLYKAGQIYTVGEALGAAFLRAGWARVLPGRRPK